MWVGRNAYNSWVILPRIPWQWSNLKLSNNLQTFSFIYFRKKFLILVSPDIKFVRWKKFMNFHCSIVICQHFSHLLVDAKIETQYKNEKKTQKHIIFISYASLCKRLNHIVAVQIHKTVGARSFVCQYIQTSKALQNTRNG